MALYRILDNTYTQPKVHILCTDCSLIKFNKLNNPYVKRSFSKIHKGTCESCKYTVNRVRKEIRTMKETAIYKNEWKAHDHKFIPKSKWTWPFFFSWKCVLCDVSYTDREKDFLTFIQTVFKLPQ